MKIVVVQSRLDSSRLPEKALLPLSGKPVLAWVLDAMKMVPADRYFLATDEASSERLFPVAQQCGWECFEGPKEDVLERFCLLIESTKADTVIRATGDNPFLFYEAARALSDEFDKRNCDYITWTGLPHGSGVEMFNAKSLLSAKELTNNTYDHEHVGPSLYGHPENFYSCMLPAPAEWNHPDYRTTIDTPADYRHALRIANFLPKKSGKKTYTSNEICQAIERPQVAHPMLVVPSVSKGHGTGHLRRCLEIALETSCDIFLPEDKITLKEADGLLEESIEKGLKEWQICKKKPEIGEYSLIVTDSFMLEKDEAVDFSAAASVVSIDEGSSFSSYSDYLLDIIPSYNLEREPNFENNAFIPLPLNRKEQKAESISKVLVSIGGEDPAELTQKAAFAFAQNGYMVTAIVSDTDLDEKNIPDALKNNLRYSHTIQKLSEKLHNYDLVVTHYGFTAFEASAAGCYVMLVATTPLHALLAHKYGFTLLQSECITPEKISELTKTPENLVPSENVLKAVKNENRTLSDFLLMLTESERLNCPVCGSSNKKKGGPNVQDAVISRTPERTFRKCSRCGMIYMAWTTDGKKLYDKSYFFEKYKEQYGKTYLEDFASIKNQCLRRVSIIDGILLSQGHTSLRMKKKGHIPSVLDIGCAYGPFLAAASDAGWQVFGTDISNDAVEYVANNLHFPAAVASFPNFDPVNEFGVGEFDAVTMWYVIEHFRNLDIVLKTVSKYLKKGGIFAFSTPSGAGISAISNTDSFFKSSPADHYSVWTPKNANMILSKYGFKIDKWISTGHHPERFPSLNEKEIDEKSLKYKMLRTVSHFRKLGDTFEVYCVKK